jgi:hypothetical protein
VGGEAAWRSGNYFFIFPSYFLDLTFQKNNIIFGVGGEAAWRSGKAGSAGVEERRAGVEREQEEAERKLGAKERNFETQGTEQGHG